MKYFFIVVSTLVFSGIANAECTAKPKLINDSYVSCTTTVDGHTYEHQKIKLTELGCNNFCKITMPAEITKDAQSKETSLSCSAKPILEEGQYVGCNTRVGSHSNISTQAELTEIGCDTFCDALTKPLTDL